MMSLSGTWYQGNSGLIECVRGYYRSWSWPFNTSGETSGWRFINWYPHWETRLGDTMLGINKVPTKWAGQRAWGTTSKTVGVLSNSPAVLPWGSVKSRKLHLSHLCWREYKYLNQLGLTAPPKQGAWVPGLDPARGPHLPPSSTL